MKSRKIAAATLASLALFTAGCSKAKDAAKSATSDVAAAASDAVSKVSDAAGAAVSDASAAAGAAVSGVSAAADTAVAAASNAVSGGATGGKVGFILPDSKSSARWESFDRPMITAACTAAGLTCDIQNAEGDKAKMATIADGMLASGVKVLAMVNLDSPSAVAIQTKAAAQGVKLIDYDRLTLNGKTDVYVSFDNVAVGKAQGEGLIQCLGGADAAKGKNIIQLSGSPTDNNATLFKQGEDAAIKDSGITVVGSEAVPDWDNQKGGQIFEQLLTKAGGKIDGVLVANDGLSLAAQAVLTKAGLSVPTTGQDATRDGLAAILMGTQCMTVYKPVKAEAQAAVDAAKALISGSAPATNATINDGARDLPYSQAAITPVFKANVKDVVADGFVTAADLCTGDVAAKCKDAGIS